MTARYHKYQSSGVVKKRRSFRWAQPALIGIGFVVAIALFFGGIFWFRAQGEDASPVEEEEQTSTIVNVVDLGVDQAPEERSKEEISLRAVNFRGGDGIASREVDDHVFKAVAIVNLPEARENEFYEGWLVREHPFNFFSLGQMVLWEDGRYALEWEGVEGDDFQDYTQFVITAEPNDGDPSPTVHVLEGWFSDPK